MLWGRCHGIEGSAHRSWVDWEKGARSAQCREQAATLLPPHSMPPTLLLLPTKRSAGHACGALRAALVCCTLRLRADGGCPQRLLHHRAVLALLLHAHHRLHHGLVLEDLRVGWGVEGEGAGRGLKQQQGVAAGHRVVPWGCCGVSCAPATTTPHHPHTAGCPKAASSIACPSPTHLHRGGAVDTRTLRQRRVLLNVNLHKVHLPGI